MPMKSEDKKLFNCSDEIKIFMQNLEACCGHSLPLGEEHRRFGCGGPP